MSVEIKKIRCPNCSSSNIRKHGVNKKRLQTSQRYFCKECQKTFVLAVATGLKNKSYPASIMLNALSYYNLGYSQKEASSMLSRKYKTNAPQKTISNWINELKQTATFSRLRKQAKQQFSSEELISSYEFLHNNLNYKYQIHSFKLQYLTNSNEKLQRLKVYLKKIPTPDFPHHIFTPNLEIEEKSDRASKSNFTALKITPLKKQNIANKLCSLALNLAKTNKERHQAIQDFFLMNDSTTIATEVPVYLTKDDLVYFTSKSFSVNPERHKTPITGHIDILQIRNNLLHILDYKPEADKIMPIEQLTIYALALASRIKLPLYLFKCAWFDENNYFEFFPLHAVYKKNK